MGVRGLNHLQVDDSGKSSYLCDASLSVDLLIHCAGYLTDRQVAVKTCTSDAVQMESFMKEVHFMMKLDHAHIVKLYGVCTRLHSDMFIIMELMKNGDLRRFLINDAGVTVHVPHLLQFAIQVEPHRTAAEPWCK